jgi:hypothetical protein
MCPPKPVRPQPKITTTTTPQVIHDLLVSISRIDWCWICSTRWTIRL